MEWFIDAAEEGEQQRGIVGRLFQISEPIARSKALGELEHR